MRVLSCDELNNVNGGSWSSALINAFTKAATTIYVFGQRIGSTLRRIRNNSYCPM